MLVEALIVTFVYILGRCEWFLGSSNIRRPIVLGTILGILLGQPAQGAIMGATLELAFIGAVSIGASMPPELISGVGSRICDCNRRRHGDSSGLGNSDCILVTGCQYCIESADSDFNVPSL